MNVLKSVLNCCTFEYDVIDKYVLCRVLQVPCNAMTKEPLTHFMHVESSRSATSQRTPK